MKIGENKVISKTYSVFDLADKDPVNLRSGFETLNEALDYAKAFTGRKLAIMKVETTRTVARLVNPK